MIEAAAFVQTPAARVSGLTKTYGSGAALVRALDDVTLDLYAGEYTAIMGPSGSGKSTLMHVCAALDTADSGVVMVGDQDLSRMNDRQLTTLRRDEIGFVFQSYNLVPTLTRVAVARALVSRPRIVFADEPTGNLDSRSGAEVLELLRAAVDEHGQTVVMVTHDPVGAAYTDRVVFLGDGRVVGELREPDREQVLEEMSQMAGEAP
jgi:putative ABC transport system ATP-binding protein